MTFFQHFPKFAPPHFSNFGVNWNPKFNHIPPPPPPMCILLKLDYSKLSVSNLFFKSYQRKTFGGLLDHLGKGRINPRSAIFTIDKKTRQRTWTVKSFKWNSNTNKTAINSVVATDQDVTKAGYGSVALLTLKCCHWYKLTK